MKNRLLVLGILLLLMLALAACKPDEPEVASTEMITTDGNSQSTGEEPTGEQAYPAATIVNPTRQSELAYPISQNDLQMLFKTWILSSSYIDGSIQAGQEKSIEFAPDNTYKITTSGDSITGEWTARLLATESNLVLKMTDGTLFSYQIVELKQDTLILRSIQDGQQIEEQFTPANW